MALADQAGKTVITSDGYEITYDANGYGRKSVAPDGTVKYYDSLGNQTTTVWTPTESTPASSTVVSQEQENADAIARIEANRANPNPQQTPQEAVAAVVAAQETATSSSPATPASDGISREQQLDATKWDSAPAGATTTKQVFDDGSSIETWPDGSTLTTNADGEQSYNNPSIGEVMKDPPTPSSPTDLSAADLAAHGPAYDDEGNLMPGWTLDEDNNPRWQGGTFVEPATQKQAAADRAAAAAAPKTAAAAKASSDSANFKQADDWRVRLSLAPSANYLYKAAKSGDILFPLKATNGVIFPYTPQITVNYKANYDPSDLTHTNYKIMMYKNSVVDDVQITCDFTAQDTYEANYLLAVIHFFRSATKMFYGQDGKSGPRAGTPPPLVYLSGFGAYQFDNHPLVITNFNFTSPTDVDYIRAGVSETWGGQAIVQSGTKEYASSGSVFGQLAEGLRDIRLKIGNLKKGAAPKEPQFKSLTNNQATYVPTKIQLQISASPIVSRNDISNNFSLTDYATGKLLRGSKRSGGGVW